jgi:two-component system, OmpR family, phosphate regulon sensor histidine kinase PhoR
MMNNSKVFGQQPFFRRIFLGYIIITLAFLFVGVALGFLVFQRYARIVQVRELLRVAEAQCVAIEPVYTDKASPALNNFVAKYAERLKLRLTIIDTNGLVLADSDKNAEKLLNHIGRPEVQSALRGHPGSATRFSVSVGRDLLYVAVPLMQQQQISGVLRVSVGVHDMRAYTQSFVLVFLLGGLILVLFIAAYALFLARAIAEPLDELNTAAQAMARGELKTRVYLRSALFTGIGATFNTMAEKLENTIVQTQQQKQELSALIDALPAGVLVVDAENKVQLFNAAIQQVFAVLPERGDYAWAFCRETVVNDLITTAHAGRGETRDLVRNNRIFQATSRIIPTGVLLLFQDVTDVRALAEIKRDFVVNASHELRTPLTAIKGFSENLVDEVTGEAKHYAEIILRNTERLINIVQDIMLLSELESGRDTLKLEPIQLRHLVDDVLLLFVEKAKTKSIGLKVSGNMEIIVTADQFKLQQVFINLIDNALKYTDTGKISVCLSAQASTVTIVITDTGIGIAPEHLSRLFERFYVIDKSRSRKTGGTGLGLAIVKHIVLLHNGTIDVASTVGVGTTITVTLPL